MSLILLIVFALWSLTLFFWALSLLVSVFYGSPPVQAPREAILKAWRLANVQRGHFVVDLGCGKGDSLVLAAKKFGAKGAGVEVSPFYFLAARLNVFLNDQSPNVKIYFGNFSRFARLLHRADAVFLYLTEGQLAKIEGWLFDNISPRAKIVSLSFRFRGRREDDRTRVKKSRLTVYLYLPTSDTTNDSTLPRRRSPDATDYSG